MPDAKQLTPVEGQSWDDCVAYLLGPRLAGEPPEAKQRQALELAAAALRAAGEHVMAENLLD